MLMYDKEWFAMLDLWEIIGHPDMEWNFGDNNAADPEQNLEEENE